MDTEILLALAASLGLTVASELAFALICRVRAPRDILLVVLVNLLTNPAVVLTYLLLRQDTDFSPVFIILPLELAAVAIEGLCYKYRGESIKRPFLFSFCANALSYCLGVIFSLIF